MTADDCPLDLSGWNPEDIKRRWREAYRHAHGFEYNNYIHYKRGWFLISQRPNSWPTYRRRKDVAAIIHRLESSRTVQSEKEKAK